jgi:16S rRNA (cytosine(1402)-N(4))-methyltransferase
MSEDDIEGIIRLYGEERYSKKIAAAIVASRRVRKIDTTFQLKEVIGSVIFDRFLVKSCSRVFQSIRIFVNDELGQLSGFLMNVNKALKSNGILCCIAYHSLEDRIVKRFFSFGPSAMSQNDLLVKSKYYAMDYDSNVEDLSKISTHSAIDESIFHKHVRLFPSESEIKSNSRARSAVMRYGVKK